MEQFLNKPTSMSSREGEEMNHLLWQHSADWKYVYVWAKRCMQPVSSNSVSLVWSGGWKFEDRRCEDLTNKCSAYRKIVSRIANSRVKNIMNKCGLQKADKIRIMNECCIRGTSVNSGTKHWANNKELNRLLIHIRFYFVCNQRNHI